MSVKNMGDSKRLGSNFEGIKLTRAEWHSLIKSNSDRYSITGYWLGMSYNKGEIPEELEGLISFMLVEKL